MSDLTQQQQTVCINKALEQIGFEDIMDMYVKDLGTKKIVVDLSAGTSVYFQVGKDRIDTDNEAGTLAGIKQVITNARDGRMPTKSEPDMHYSKDMPAAAMLQNIIDDKLYMELYIHYIFAMRKPSEFHFSFSLFQFSIEGYRLPSYCLRP